MNVPIRLHNPSSSHLILLQPLHDNLPLAILQNLQPTPLIQQILTPPSIKFKKANRNDRVTLFTPPLLLSQFRENISSHHLLYSRHSVSLTAPRLTVSERRRPPPLPLQYELHQRPRRVFVQFSRVLEFREGVVEFERVVLDVLCYPVDFELGGVDGDEGVRYCY